MVRENSGQERVGGICLEPGKLFAEIENCFKIPQEFSKAERILITDRTSEKKSPHVCLENIRTPNIFAPPFAMTDIAFWLLMLTPSLYRLLPLSCCILLASSKNVR